MHVIHFTEGATDPLETFGAKGARFVPIADGEGESHVSCLHLQKGAIIAKASTISAVALLVVHGRVAVVRDALGSRIQFLAGMGAVFDSDEPYSLESETHAIVLIVETDLLYAHYRGISSPERIAGQTWPSDAVINA